MSRRERVRWNSNSPVLSPEEGLPDHPLYNSLWREIGPLATTKVWPLILPYLKERPRA